MATYKNPALETTGRSSVGLAESNSDGEPCGRVKEVHVCEEYGGNKTAVAAVMFAMSSLAA